MLAFVGAAVAASTLFTTAPALNADGMNEYDLALDAAGNTVLTRLFEQRYYEASGTLASGIFIVMVRSNSAGAIIRFHTPATDRAGGYFRLCSGLTPEQVASNLGAPTAAAKCAIGFGASTIDGRVALYRFRDHDVRMYFDGPDGGLAVVCVSNHVRAVARPFIPD